MTRHLRILGGLLAVAALAACGEPSTPDDALLRDLDQAQAASIELAPRAAGTAVVSAIESPPAQAPSRATTRATRPAPRRAAVAQRPAPEPELAQAPEPAPQPAPSEAPVAGAPAPTVTIDQPTRTQRPTHRGPYKTTAEVIRNAPFPINP